MKTKNDEYIAEIQKASAECWKCFVVSRQDRKSSQAIFSSVRLKYKNRRSVAYEYVNRYATILSELVSVDDKIVNKMMEASRKVWSKFKEKINDIYSIDVKNDEYWEKLIQDFIAISEEDWDVSIIEYVKRYICICIDEIDRKYRRENAIREGGFQTVV